MDGPFSQILPNQVTVNTGAGVVLPTKPARDVIFQADPDNAADIFLGASNVASNGTGVCFQLKPGASVEVPIGNLNVLYATTTVNGQVLFATVLL